MPEPIQTPPRKRRRWPKLLLAFVVFLSILVWFAPAIIARTELRHRIVDSALVDFHGTIRSDGASMGWLSPVEFTDVKMTEPDGRVAVTALKVTSSKTLLQLALDRSDLGTFTIHQPQATISVDGGKINVERWIEVYTADDGTPPKPQRLAFAIEVAEGTAKLRGNPDTELRNVAFKFTSPKSRGEPMEMHFAATATDGGKLDATMKLGTDTGLSLAATAFPLDSLGPLLPRFAPEFSVAGSLTADWSGSWNFSDGKPATLRFEGSANVTDLRLRAPQLKGETLNLKTVALLPSEIATADNGRINIKKFKLLCDVGDLSVAGEFHPDFDFDKLLKQPNIEASANVDIAKLAALLPKTFSLRADTELLRGSITASLKSEAGPVGTVWVGDIRTRDFEARRGNQPFAWKTPLEATFRARLGANNWPVFDDLKILSEFVSVAARGQPEAFSAAARLDLHKLVAQLGQFIDFDGLTIQGEAVAHLNTKTVPNAPTTEFTGSIDWTKLEIRDGERVLLAEPELHAALDAVGTILKSGSLKLDRGRFRIFTDPLHPERDQVSVTLTEPIDDILALHAGRADIRLDGELRNWKARLGPLVGLPKNWELAGRGTISATAAFSAERLTAEKIYLNMTQVRVARPGMDFHEPKLEVAAAANFERKTRSGSITGLQFWAGSIGVSSTKLDFLRDEKHGYGITGPLTVHAVVLESTYRALGMQDKTGSDAIRGIAKGTATVDARVDRIAFSTDLKIDNFSYGPAAKPTWSEPWITVKGGGKLDIDGDALTLQPTKIARDGFAIDAEGTIAKFTTLMDLNLSGQLTYDLTKVEPQLKEFLGKSAKAAGTGTKPFALTGNLSEGGKNLNARVGEPAKNLEQIKGNAAIGWTALQAFGFDVGAAELKAKAEKGVVNVNRVDAKFGNGLVRLEPTLVLNPGFYDLSFAKGTVIEKAKLTPVACADAIGYALPAIANVAQAEGTFSFDLGNNRIPLVAPTTGTMAGTLLIHEAEVSPGPVVTQIASLFSAKPLKLQLTKDQRVPIEFKDGRVHHKDFAITIDGYTVRTSGSVGVDGTLAMILEVPLTGKLAANIVPAEQPKIREALGKQTVKIAISGTLAKPQIDQGAFRNIIADTVRGTMKDVAKDTAEDLIFKNLNKFLPKK